jgi:hypothetical protein
MTDELKPCPFCGEDAEHVHVCAYEEIVRCTNECCFVRPSITCELPEECFELWNTRAAGASEGQAWQPIATAPRDGSNILIRFGRDGISQAKYVAGTPHPWKFIDTNDGITWLINHAVDTEYGPTHWMPLPPPDTSAEIAALRERIAGMEKDAQRYRWLRNEHFPTADNPPLAQVVWKFGSNRRGSEWANLIDGNDLDAAIDRARQSGEEGKS